MHAARTVKGPRDRRRAASMLSPPYDALTPRPGAHPRHLAALLAILTVFVFELRGVPVAYAKLEFGFV